MSTFSPPSSPVTMTITGTPSTLSPVNKEIWWVLNSGSSSLPNFKYLVNVDSRMEPFNSTSFTRLGTYKLPPRPITGNAQYSPHRILKGTYVYDFEPFAVGWATVSNQLQQYRLSYGLQYDPGATYTATANVGGFMSILTLGNTAQFAIGDIITISKDNKQVNISYDGTCSVTDKPLNAALVTDKPFGLTTSIVESGIITSVVRQSGTTSVYETYNGTRQYLERTVDFGKIFQLPTDNSYGPARFLTDWDMPQKKIFTGEWETLSTILATQSGYRFWIETFDSSGNTLGLTSSLLSKSNYRRQEIGVGTQNISLLVGTTSFFNNVDNYDVWVEYDNIINLTYKARFNVAPVGQKQFQYVYGLTAAGTYNSKPYYIVTPPANQGPLGGTFYIWFDSTDIEWEVSNALGGGNQFLTAPVDNPTPPAGNFFAAFTWITGQDWTDGFGEFIIDYGSRVSEIKTYKLLQNCKPYQPVRLMFVNREGGNDYFTFTLDTKRSVNIEKTLYTKILPYNYSVGMRGDTTISQRVKPQYVITSDWLDDKESIWLEQLLTSPEVYWLDGSNIIPIVITDTAYEVKTQLRNQTFNLTLTFELAHNINLQNE